jgi:Tfp pilus assembly protein PilO
VDKLKQWVALTVVGCLAILAGGWFLLVSPKKSEAAELQTQASAQDATNAKLRTQLEVLKAQAKDLPKKQAELARVAAKIPADPALPGLIRALTGAADSAGVELVTVTPGPPAAFAAASGASATAQAPDATGADAAPAAGGLAGTLAAIPLTINVVGGYFEVAQFMANLEDLPRAVRVTNLALTPGLSPTAGDAAGDNADGSSISTTITGTVFMAADRPQAEPAAIPDSSEPDAAAATDAPAT